MELGPSPVLPGCDSLLRSARGRVVCRPWDCRYQGGHNGVYRNQTSVVTSCKGGRSQFAFCSTGEFAQLVFSFIVSRAILKSTSVAKLGTSVCLAVLFQRGGAAGSG